MSGITKDANGKSSPKRIMGILGYGSSFITTLVISVYSVKTGNDIGPNAASLLSAVMYSSAGMLAATVVEFVAKKGQASGNDISQMK